MRMWIFYYFRCGKDLQIHQSLIIVLLTVSVDCTHFAPDGEKIVNIDIWCETNDDKVDDG